MKYKIVSFFIYSFFLCLVSSAYAQNSDSVRAANWPKHPQDVKEIIADSSKPQKIKTTSFSVLGFVKLLATGDWGNVMKSTDFITSLIPIYPDPREKEFRFSLDPRSSRITFKGLYQVTDKNKLLMYLEMDFYNPAQQTSVVPYLRHAYAAYGKFLMGKTWSTIYNVDATPNQVDLEGPNSIPALHNPQIRFTQYFKRNYSFAFAIESHHEDYTPYPEIDEDKDFQLIPDVTAYFQKQGAWGNIRLAGVLSNISYTDSLNQNVDHLTGWGVNFSGYLKFLKRETIWDAFYWGCTYGKGISYYIQDISGAGYEAMPDKYNDMSMLPALAGFVAYKHTWSKQMETNLIASYVAIDNSHVDDEMIFDNSWYYAANLMYNPNERMNFGIEFLYGKNTNKKQDWGEGYRIQLMGVYFF